MIQIVLGVAAVGFGIITLALRIWAPHRLGKLDAMKARFGPRGGTAIHVLAYTVMPVAFGILALVLARQGITIF